MWLHVACIIFKTKPQVNKEVRKSDWLWKCVERRHISCVSSSLRSVGNERTWRVDRVADGVNARSAAESTQSSAKRIWSELSLVVFLRWRQRLACRCHRSELQRSLHAEPDGDAAQQGFLKWLQFKEITGAFEHKHYRGFVTVWHIRLFSTFHRCRLHCILLRNWWWM